MKKSRFTKEKIISILREADAGVKVVEPRECRDFSARQLSVTATRLLTGDEHAVVTYLELD